MGDALDRLLELAGIPPPPPADEAEPELGLRPDLARLLPILRCPETGQPLAAAEAGWLCTADGSRRWPLVAGRPNLFPGLAEPKLHDASEPVTPLDQPVLRFIRSADGPLLHLGAGATARKYAHVVEADSAVFQHTDALADAYRLPFADQSFARVVACGFEQYRDPQGVAGEVFRVLQRGGDVLVRSAFLQPLHGAPQHFYNATRYGVERWFAAFETAHLEVPEDLHPGHSIGWLASECEAALRREVSGAAADLFRGATIAEFVDMWRDPATRTNRLWRNFLHVSQATQGAIAAGFEFLGRRPLSE